MQLVYYNCLIHSSPPHSATQCTPKCTLGETSRKMASLHVKMILGESLYTLYIVIFLSNSWHYTILCEAKTASCKSICNQFHSDIVKLKVHSLPRWTRGINIFLSTQQTRICKPFKEPRNRFPAWWGPGSSWSIWWGSGSYLSMWYRSATLHFGLSSANWCRSGSRSLWCGSGSYLAM